MRSTKKKLLKPGEKLVLKLTVEQANLVADLPCIPGELLDIVHHSRVMDDIVSMRCTLAMSRSLLNAAG